MGLFRSTQTRSAGSGRFHCPACHEDRAYELVIITEQRQLLGISIGAPRDAARKVVCQVCRTRFSPDILFDEDERRAHRVEAALRQGLRGLIVRMVLEDGRVAPEERAVLARVHEELLGRRLDADALEAEVQAAADDERPAAQFARDMAGFLDDPDKATVLRAARRVAMSDRDYDPREHALLVAIGEGLGMSAAAIRTVIDDGADTDERDGDRLDTDGSDPEGSGTERSADPS